MEAKLKLLFLTFATVIFLESNFGDPKTNHGNTGYVGSKKCYFCHEILHPEIIKKWQTSSHHITMKSGSESKNIWGNKKTEPSVKKKDILAIISQEEGRYVFVGSDFQIFPQEGWQIDKTFPPHDEIGIKGKNIDASQKCLGCHTTGYFVSQKKYVEEGIGCEACHGPGSKHIESNGSKETIVNPSNFPSDRNRMICGQCHSLGNDPSGKHPFPVMNGGDPFQPGQDLTLGFVDNKPIVSQKGGEYSLLIQSIKPFSCQICINCHDPHGSKDNPSMLIDNTSKLCLRCHGDISSYVTPINPERHWGGGKYLCWECHETVHTH